MESADQTSLNKIFPKPNIPLADLRDKGSESLAKMLTESWKTSLGKKILPWLQSQKPQGKIPQEDLRVKDLRTKIDQLLTHYGSSVNLADRIPGYEFVDSGDPKEDCIPYVFGMNIRRSWQAAPIIVDWNLVDPKMAQDGDIILYLNEKGNWMHVGKALGEGRVESKMGGLGIYRHDYNVVAGIYGPNIIGFQNPIYNIPSQ